MVILISVHGRTSFRALHLTVIVEPLLLLHLITLFIILRRCWLRLIFVRFKNSFFGDADEDLAILDLPVLALERQPIGNAACFAMRPVKHEIGSTNAAVTDQVVATPD